MNVDAARAQLRGRVLGRVLEHYPRLGSTNDRAAALARGGAPEGLVVVADTQEAGRGRLGRRWEDTPGHALLASVLLRPTFDGDHWPLLGLAAAVAAAEAIRALSGIPVRTKWPNDLVIVAHGEGKGSGDTPRRVYKAGGILLEAEGDWVVVGVGINILAAPVLAADVSALPPACLAEYGEPPSRFGLLVSLMTHLEALYGRLNLGEGAVVAAAFSELDILTGMAVTLNLGGQTVAGIARGIDAAGGLILATAAGLETFRAGEVRLIRT